MQSLFIILFWGTLSWALPGSREIHPLVPDVEFRALFLATAWNIDWPSSSSASPATQQQELIDYLDLMQEANFNALHFHVRPASDALYASNVDPWSRFLTGTQGTAPNPLWDPLSFCITEAHSRGIEVHAWLNPYRANTAASFDGLHSSHIANVLRQYAYIYDSYVYMDPASLQVEDWLIEVIEDIIARYDVDGIHYDDYFYPYPVAGVDFPDDATYEDYLQGGGTLARDDWRRANVDRMVERTYMTIKNEKPGCVFSISPFGIYRPGHPEGMAPPIVGMDPYSEMYADAKLWLQMGWVDAMAPQIYWAIDPPAQSYPVIVDWWLDNNPLGRLVYPCNGVYKMSDFNDWPVSEIVNQVDLTRDEGRRGKECLGNNFYSAKSFRDNTKGLYDVFQADVYPTPAVTPPLGWIEAATPIQMDAVQVDGDIITWTSSGDAMFWRLYCLQDDTWRLCQIIPGRERSVEVTKGIYTVVAVDASRREGDKVLVTVE
ncbi:hypothetical protein CAPTEDRAFT_109895 [Capitella teleta]|uniref:Glycosyl hydrolase-like 10 domain-containing protein n=1 Tax=Capitella teleta TaxID=283909 RepID=R7VED6_CAPTE|nr:hypothetical protein CAPTEDRAFT_109895 [Capitella teleta]|eukprot:ELU14045.1 hypothetical protein CAPTEDRAFT_109895 [Capitella teleta]